jgi:hypothetical protein
MKRFCKLQKETEQLVSQPGIHVFHFVSGLILLLLSQCSFTNREAEYFYKNKATYLEIHRPDFKSEEIYSWEPNPRLEFLSLGGTEVRDLNGLNREKFPKLASLFLEDTDIIDDDFFNWKDPPSLTRLFLPNTNITTLEWTYKFPNLRRLNVENTNVKSLKPLIQNKKLIHLWIGRTYVSSLEPLKEVPNLQFLGIDLTSIPEREIQEFRKERPYVKIVRRDYSP